MPNHFRKSLSKFTNYVRKPTQNALPAASNQVSLKGERTKVRACLQEMSALLVCLKTNDNNNAMCSKEIEAFKKCQTEHTIMMTKRKEAEEKGLLASGKLPNKTINKLLSKFPLPTER